MLGRDGSKWYALIHFLTYHKYEIHDVNLESEGGHLRPDIYGHIPTYIERSGLEAGLEIAEFEYAHIQALKDLLREENIDCDLNITRNMNVYLDEESAEKAKLAYEMLQARGVKLAEDLHYTGKRDAEVVSIYPLSSITYFSIKWERY